MTDSKSVQTSAVEVAVCVTCRHDSDTVSPVAGERLLALMQQAIDSRPALSDVHLRPQRCLMACKRGCAVALRSPGKMAYVIGDLAAEEWAVEALADYLEQYQLTTDGVVRFAHWPQGVKGRFVARVPPLSDD